MGHELAIGRMVHSLDADDFGSMLVLVLLDVPEKLQLCRRRPDEQELLAAFE